jgi:hypothetical protein
MHDSIGGSVTAALRRKPLGEAPAVLAVVVVHEVRLRPRHGSPLRAVELPLHPRMGAGGARQRPALVIIGHAGGGGVPAVVDDEGRVGPVHGDLALLRGPVAAVPQRGVNGHGLAAGVRQVGVAFEGADEEVVDLEDDILGVPDDGVGVVVGGGVEPEVELVFLLAVAVGPNVGVEHHRGAARVAHELHVDLVVPGALTGRQLQ